MPSSMCWPCGDMPQRWAEASLASRNTSLRVCRSKMPRRFTQGPRLVDTVTSGLVVMMCVGEFLQLALAAARSRPGCRRTRPGWTSCGPPSSASAAPPAPERSARSSARPSGGQFRRRTARRRGIRRKFVSERRPGPRTGPTHGRAGCRMSVRNCLHLLLGHQAGVVVLVAGERQAHALDGVGDEAGRLVAVGLGGAQSARSGFRCRGRPDWSSARPVRRRTADR